MCVDMRLRLMAYIVMAYVVMAHIGLCSYGPCVQMCVDMRLRLVYAGRPGSAYTPGLTMLVTVHIIVD